jgi:hypothetical protein
MHQHEHSHDDASEKPAGYCVACKAKREIKDPKQVERGGGPAIEGACSICGAKIFMLGVELRAEN